MLSCSYFTFHSLFQACAFVCSLMSAVIKTGRFNLIQLSILIQANINLQDSIPALSGKEAGEQPVGLQSIIGHMHHFLTRTLSRHGDLLTW